MYVLCVNNGHKLNKLSGPWENRDGHLVLLAPWQPPVLVFTFLPASPRIEERTYMPTLLKGDVFKYCQGKEDVQDNFQYPFYGLCKCYIRCQIQKKTRQNKTQITRVDRVEIMQSGFLQPRP